MGSNVKIEKYLPRLTGANFLCLFWFKSYNVSTDHKSLNRIELSQLVQELFHF